MTDTARAGASAPDPYAAARPYYERELAAGVDRFLEPRRESCPWCGAGTLDVRLRTRDLYQLKPGRFTLDRCRTCGHIFQNPRLSPAGLDFYYRDFFDGIGAPTWEAIFAGWTDLYTARARMPAPFLPGGRPPQAWLDVGTGYGHFAATAREIWPRTVFGGLDIGASVEQGAERGWLDHAHRGEFADHEQQLTGRYDVLSMHHYLEHTREPHRELDVATRVLAGSGFLLIEVPDPQFPLARLFGQYWGQWGQPWHQHFIPAANLMAALTHRGFTVLALDRGAAHVRGDVATAATMPLLSLAPDPRLPWLREQVSERRARRRGAAWTRAAPLLAAAARLDTAVAALARRADIGSAYRVLARKDC